MHQRIEPITVEVTTMDDMEQRYTTRDIADMLGVEAVTVRKYALALEKYGFSVYRSDGKNRSFSEQDVMAFRQLMTLRERSGVNVETAAQIVASKHKGVTVDSVSIVHNDGEALPQHYDDRYDLLAAKVEQLIALQQQAAATVQALPDPVQQRAERFNERMTERRVENKLRDEAEEAWNAKSAAERMRKVGWFRKEEDTVVRESFIRKYIEARFEDCLRKEYGFEGKGDIEHGLPLG